jgi:hypothetical protein
MSITYISNYRDLYMPKKRVGRPEIYPVKKLIRIDEDMNDGIERWRKQQTPVPTVTDAIRALIALGLAAPQKRTKGRKASVSKRESGS